MWEGGGGKSTFLGILQNTNRRKGKRNMAFSKKIIFIFINHVEYSTYSVGIGWNKCFN